MIYSVREELAANVQRDNELFRSCRNPTWLHHLLFYAWAVVRGIGIGVVVAYWLGVT